MASAFWDDLSMSASALSECVKGVVRREAVRAGSVPHARAALARRHRLSPGTLENAERGRAKRIDHRLVMAVISEIQSEWARLEHEIQILRQMGATPMDLIAAQQHLREAKALLAI